MAAIGIITGMATRDGLYVRCGDGFRLVTPDSTPVVQMMQELTPLGAAVRQACSAILAGEVQPCRWCNSIAPCDCLRWQEYMLLDPDPHGDLSQFSDEDLPY